MKKTILALLILITLCITGCDFLLPTPTPTPKPPSIAQRKGSVLTPVGGLSEGGSEPAGGDLIFTPTFTLEIPPGDPDADLPTPTFTLVSTSIYTSTNTLIPSITPTLPPGTTATFTPIPTNTTKPPVIPTPTNTTAPVVPPPPTATNTSAPPASIPTNTPLPTATFTPIPPTNTPVPPSGCSPSGSSAFESEVISLINTERAKEGLSPLSKQSQLTTVARSHSEDMACNDFFFHTSPTTGSPYDRLAAIGYSYSAAAENIAAGYASAAAVVSGWMSSPGHRANILGSYTQIGIGYAYWSGSSYGSYWTAVFGRP